MKCQCADYCCIISIIQLFWPNGTGLGTKLWWSSHERTWLITHFQQEIEKTNNLKKQILFINPQ
jgi:hypothetical protein